MPVRKGNKLVELREEVINELNRTFQSSIRDAPDFTNFVNNLLLNVMKKEKFLSQYKPYAHLTYCGNHQGSVFIRDEQRNCIAELIFKDEMIYCNSPDSVFDCEHTRFGLMLIDIVKYMQEK
jgi:hypothetical protein